MKAGARISARHIALLSACGVNALPAHSPTYVDFAFTGNEVIRSGIPGPGEVRDAFSTSFPTLVREWGAHTNRIDRLGDDPEEVRNWLSSEESQRAHILVLTGGSGHSGQDFAQPRSPNLPM